jgi:hypothetical protein
MHRTATKKLLSALCGLCVPWIIAIFSTTHIRATAQPPAPSDGCISCHKNAKDPHPVQQSLTCIDCHGGNGTATTKQAAHPMPAIAAAWRTAANPPSSFTLLNHERHEWIRFVNPSDLRVAPVVCGRCHEAIVRTVAKGPMVNSAQVYSTALYNNATLPFKDAMFAENYTPRGEPQIIRTNPAPTAEETRTKGVLPALYPFPRFEAGQPGNIFRVFERGGGPKSELGNPNREDVPGQPDVTVSNRGYGTQGSVDPVLLGAQKVRLNDPVLSFLGTNDSPGDYRQSGCASCHVIRFVTSSRARFRRASASPATCTTATASSTRISGTCGGTNRPTASSSIRARSTTRRSRRSIASVASIPSRRPRAGSGATARFSRRSARRTRR